MRAMNKLVVKVLLRAADLMEAGWSRTGYDLLTPSRRRYCALAAIAQAALDVTGARHITPTRTFKRVAASGGIAIMRWNYRPDQTKANVVQTFRLAAGVRP